MAYGEIGRVRKHRTLFLVGRTRIHLDRVDGLGDFLELEVVLADDEPFETGVRETHSLMEKLGIQPSQLNRRRLCRPSVQALAVARRWLRTLDRKAMSDALVNLQEAERSCAERYLSLLRNTLADNLRAVWLFGSFARGDMWPAHMPMNSDIDLLVITESEVSSQTQEALLNETYPLYLECGRQISPQFWTVRKFGQPSTEKEEALRQHVLGDGKILLSRGGAIEEFLSLVPRDRPEVPRALLQLVHDAQPEFGPFILLSHRPRTSLPPSARTPRAIWIALLRTMPSSRILTRIASKKTSG